MTHLKDNPKKILVICKSKKFGWDSPPVLKTTPSKFRPAAFSAKRFEIYKNTHVKMQKPRNEVAHTYPASTLGLI